MKKTLILLFLIVSCQLQAQLHTFSKKPIIHQENFQKQRVHWGYFLGFNSYDFKFFYKENQPQEIEVKSTTSFNVGLIGNLRLQEYLDFRLEPGLFYTQRNLKFPGFDNDRDAIRNVKSTYIHVPLLLKFSSKRIGNFRPYMVGGSSMSYNLSSNSKSLTDNSERRFRMNKVTFNYELGFGVDIYLEYFIFSPSIRGVFGIGNEIIPDNDPNSLWTGNVDAMKTRAVLLNFAFH